MRKALVVGASGGMGYAIVQELSGRRIEVVAFARKKERLKDLFGENPYISIFPGDVRNETQLQQAAEGVDVIYDAVNLPYSEWHTSLKEVIKTITNVAKEMNTKLVAVDNVYGYGIHTDKPVNETAHKKPHTKKGKLRLYREQIIKQADVPYLIVHFPDFYGPYVGNGQLNYMLEQMATNKKAGFIGKKSIAREHIYTPDGANALVELSLHEAAYNQNWNIPAADVITGKEVIEIAQQYTGNRKSVYTITKGFIRLAGIFDKQLREFVEMYYLTELPLVLDGSKYEREIGALPRTPYHEGIQATIDYIKGKHNRS